VNKFVLICGFIGAFRILYTEKIHRSEENFQQKLSGITHESLNLLWMERLKRKRTKNTTIYFAHA
jgi:hypothetical protein